MRTALPDPHARKCRTCISITLNHWRRKNVSENDWLASTYWNPLILWTSAIIYLSHDLWDRRKNGNLFTFKNFFTVCLFLLSWDSHWKRERSSTTGIKDNHKQPSLINVVKRPSPEAATQPLGGVRSMKVCPGSVSAQWKSRTPLLLTPHYPTQYSDPGRQLKWVTAHERTSIHPKWAVLLKKCAFVTFVVIWTSL